MDTTEVKEYIASKPGSALSAQYVSLLDDAEQRPCILALIEQAVYCDAWEVYFEYAAKHEVALTQDVVHEAIQMVGLDPCSASLWITAANACPDPQSTRDMYRLAFQVPLYGTQRVYDAYVAFEEMQSSVSGVTVPIANSDECCAASSLLNSEPRWPGRYAEPETETDKVELRTQWMGLLLHMEECLYDEVVPADLQKRRIDLAFRQLCTQLPDDDSCWYLYNLYERCILQDEVSAGETVEKGLRHLQRDSFALRSTLAAMARAPPKEPPIVWDRQATVLIDQRAACGAMTGEPGKDQIRAFRAIGKQAASEGISDWKVYSHWNRAEDMVVHDDKLAAKVLDNGIICCSSSPSDAILLGAEAVEYHLLHRRERETLGFAEQQIELLSSSMHTGKLRAAWNSLVSAEHILGLSSAKAEERRAEVFPTTPLQSFMETYRVGNYLPFTQTAFEWFQFAADFAAEKRQEREALFKDVQPTRHRPLFPVQLEVVDCEVPDVDAWAPFTRLENRIATKEGNDPDDVVGPRDLRGRWVYRMKLDAATEARLRREEQRRSARRGTEETVCRAESAMGRLVERVGRIPLRDHRVKHLHSLSIDWLLQLLVSAELNLGEGKKAKGG